MELSEEASASFVAEQALRRIRSVNATLASEQEFKALAADPNVDVETLPRQLTAELPD